MVSSAFCQYVAITKPQIDFHIKEVKDTLLPLGVNSLLRVFANEEKAVDESPQAKFHT